MNITIKVQCTDKSIDVNYDLLSKYRSFDMQLTNCNKTETVNSYIYTIPYVKVDCNAELIESILYKSLCIKMDGKEPHIEGSKSLNVYDVLYYNSLYFCKVVKHWDWGFDSKKFYPLLLYIKEKAPKVNVYTFLSDGGFQWGACVLVNYSYKLGSKWSIDYILVKDLIKCINLFSSNDDSPVIKFIIQCYKHGYENTLKKYFNPETFWNESNKFYFKQSCVKMSEEIKQYPYLKTILLFD